MGNDGPTKSALLENPTLSSLTIIRFDAASFQWNPIISYRILFTPLSLQHGKQPYKENSVLKSAQGNRISLESFPSRADSNFLHVACEKEI